jgi:signal peptidase I
MKAKIILSVLTSFACMLLLYYRPFRIVIVDGISMNPTFHHGQILIGYKTNNINRNDIVVCDTGDGTIIKRVKYIGGDHISYLLDIKGLNSILLEGYDTKELLKLKKTYGSLLTITKVPSNSFYVLGDNLQHSDDSRRFGTLAREEISYKILGY